MEASYETQLQELASKLVTPQRFGKAALAETVATVFNLYPELPQAQIMYFPDRQPVPEQGE